MTFHLLSCKLPQTTKNKKTVSFFATITCEWNKQRKSILQRQQTSKMLQALFQTQCSDCSQEGHQRTNINDHLLFQKCLFSFFYLFLLLQTISRMKTDAHFCIVYYLLCFLNGNLQDLCHSHHHFIDIICSQWSQCGDSYQNQLQLDQAPELYFK